MEWDYGHFCDERQIKLLRVVIIRSLVKILGNIGLKDIFGKQCRFVSSGVLDDSRKNGRYYREMRSSETFQ